MIDCCWYWFFLVRHALLGFNYTKTNTHWRILLCYIAEAPPKRDFIKENVRSVRQIEMRNALARSETDLRKLNNDWRQRAPNGRNASPAPGAKKSNSTNELNGKVRASSKQTKSRNIRKIDCETRMDNSDDSRPNSVQSRDAFSQTESVDDDYFLKDVIIRYIKHYFNSGNRRMYILWANIFVAICRLPSASVMDTIKRNSAISSKSKSEFELNFKSNELDEVFNGTENGVCIHLYEIAIAPCNFSLLFIKGHWRTPKYRSYWWNNQVCG